MRKVYLLIYADSLGSREEIKEFLTISDKVETWRFDMPNSFYIISEHSASEISGAIRKRFRKGRYLVTEISDNRQGMLLTDTWYFIKHKNSKKNV